MVKPISQPRSYEGYGSGAATPDSSQLAPRVPKSTTRNINAPQQAAKQGWKPSVSRTRPDLPTNPPAKAQRVAKPQQAPAPKPTPARKPRAAAKAAANAAQAAAAGVSRSRAVVPVGDQRVTVDGKATRLPQKGIRAKLPKIGGGLLMAANNAFLIGSSIQAWVDADDYAKDLWESDPTLAIKYASPDDLAQDLRGSQVMQTIGGLVDTAAMGFVQRGAASLLAPLVGAGPAGWIAIGIAFFALPIILDAVTSGNPETNPGEIIQQQVQRAEEEDGIKSMQVGPVEVPTGVIGATGAAFRFGAAYYTSVYGMNFGDQFYRATPLSDMWRIFGWNESITRTPEQKQKLRLEMGAQQWNTYDGPVVTYKTFGPRTEEVKTVLSQGFFLRPIDETEEIIFEGKKQTVRKFMFDYQAFTDWFEKSMWIAGVSNDPESIKAQARMLPPLDERITKVLTQQAPLTDAERRVLFRQEYEKIELYGVKEGN